MAYQYCKCGAELDEPTIREILEDYRCCPQCPRHIEIEPDCAPRALIELLDRIEELENTLSEHGINR